MGKRNESMDAAIHYLKKAFPNKNPTKFSSFRERLCHLKLMDSSFNTLSY